MKRAVVELNKIKRQNDTLPLSKICIKWFSIIDRTMIEPSKRLFKLCLLWNFEAYIYYWKLFKNQSDEGWLKKREKKIKWPIGILAFFWEKCKKAKIVTVSKKAPFFTVFGEIDQKMKCFGPETAIFTFFFCILSSRKLLIYLSR